MKDRDCHIGYLPSTPKKAGGLSVSDADTNMTSDTQKQLEELTAQFKALDKYNYLHMRNAEDMKKELEALREEVRAFKREIISPQCHERMK